MKILEALLAETFELPADHPRVQGVLLELERRRLVDRRRLERERQDQRNPAAPEDIYGILSSLGASRELIEGLAAVTQGKLWYHPAIHKKAERQALRDAVLADRSGDVKEVARRHQVAPSTVYYWRSLAS